MVDDVGYTIYSRCLQGKIETKLMNNGRMKCHSCGMELEIKPELIKCDCGYSYIYREYRRSFRKNNMPEPDEGAPAFVRFISAWERARDYTIKMQAIDRIIHDFHQLMMTGNKGRMVAIN